MIQGLPLAVLIVAMMGLAAYLPGRLTQRLLGLPPRDRGELLWPLALGIGWLGNLLLVMGLAHTFSPPLLLGLIGLLALGGSGWLLRDWTRLAGMRTPAPASNRERFWQRVTLALLALFLGIGFVEVLAPATAFDTLSYHFLIPVDYLRWGGIKYRAFVPYNAPHLAELLAVIPFALQGELAAQLMFFAFALLFTAVIWQIGARHYGQLPGLLAALLIVATPMFTYIKTSGLVEVLLAAVTLMALWTVFSAISLHPEAANKRARHGWLAMGGGLLGVACGIKYYGLFSALLIPLMIAVDGLARGRGWRAIAGDLGWLLGGILLMGLPFYLKSWLLTGNPLYPALYSIFGGTDWSAELARAAKQNFNTFKRLPDPNILTWLFSPWDMTMNGAPYDASRNGYGPLFLALVPLLGVAALRGERLMAWTQRLRPGASLASWLGWYGVGFWALWFLLAFHRGRHLFPVVALLAIFAAVASVRILTTRGYARGWKIGVALVLLVSLSFQLGVSVIYHRQFIAVAFGMQSPDDYRHGKRAFSVDIDWANAHLPLSARVVNLIGNYGYYLHREQFFPSPYFQGRVDWTQVDDADQYHRWLCAQGFDYVLTQEPERGPAPGTPAHDAARMLIDRAQRVHRQLRERYGELLYEATREERLSRTAPMGSSTSRVFIFRICAAPQSSGSKPTDVPITRQ